MYNLPQNNKLNIKEFSKILELKFTTNSYKFFWLYGILEEVQLGKRKIYFDSILENMIYKSWNLAFETNLCLGLQDKLEPFLFFLKSNFKVKKNISKEDFIKILKTLNCEEYDKLKKYIYNFVPYRLISPFYKELKGIPDYKKNKLIKNFSILSDKALYQIKENYIIINDNWFHYLYNYQLNIEKWIDIAFVNYLESRNIDIHNFQFIKFNNQVEELVENLYFSYKDNPDNFLFKNLKIEKKLSEISFKKDMTKIIKPLYQIASNYNFKFNNH